MTVAVQFAPPPLTTQFGAEIGLRVPLLGLVTILKLKLWLSISVALSTTAAVVSSFVITDWPLSTGASFTDITAIATVAMFESWLPSLTLYVKLSLPL